MLVDIDFCFRPRGARWLKIHCREIRASEKWFLNASPGPWGVSWKGPFQIREWSLFGFLCKQSLTQEVESKPVFLGEEKEGITPGSQGEWDKESSFKGFLYLSWLLLWATGTQSCWRLFEKPSLGHLRIAQQKWVPGAFFYWFQSPIV